MNVIIEEAVGLPLNEVSRMLRIAAQKIDDGYVAGTLKNGSKWEVLGL